MLSCSQRLLSTTTILAVLWAGFASAQCYRPNGTAIVLADEGWFQCPTSANGHSQCCGKEEVCMPMGLCGSADATESDKTKGYWYREYCSDPTWGSSKCSNACLQNGFQSGTILTWCEDESVCCGFKNTNCCDRGEGAFLDSNGRVIKVEDPTTTSKSVQTTTSSKEDELEEPTTTSSTTSSKEEEEEPEETSSSESNASTTKSAVSQVTVTQTAAVTTTNEDGQTSSAEIVETVLAAGTAPPDASDLIAAPDKGGLSGGAAAGIGAGVGVLAMLLLGGAFFLWRRNNKKKKLEQYYSAGGHALPPYRGHQPTDSEDGVYLGGFKPTGTADQDPYSAKIAAETNPGHGYPAPVPPPKSPTELPHHYPQQYAHELPPHAQTARHEMPAEHTAAHEMGVGSPRQAGFAGGNAHGTTDGISETR